MTRLGFTGSREGMTAQQAVVVRRYVEQATALVHGDCIGADEQADAMANERGIPRFIYPGSFENLRAWTNCPFGPPMPSPSAGSVALAEPEHPTKRNARIVADCALLVATPRRGSRGTWSRPRNAGFLDHHADRERPTRGRRRPGRRGVSERVRPLPRRLPGTGRLAPLRAPAPEQPLTAQELVFVAAFHETRNRSEAARRAGYGGTGSPDAQRLLRRPEVARACLELILAEMPRPDAARGGDATSSIERARRKQLATRLKRARVLFLLLDARPDAEVAEALGGDVEALREGIARERSRLMATPTRLPAMLARARAELADLEQRMQVLDAPSKA